MTLRGATILTGTKVIGAQRDGALWRVVTQNAQGQTTHFARALVNAAGPRATEVLHGPVHVALKQGARLVRGCHIVTRRLYDHDRRYFFQGKDGRIIFAIPDEGDFTLIRHRGPAPQGPARGRKDHGR